MGLSIIAFWVLRFPVAWILSMVVEMGPAGIFWAFPISNVCAATVALAWFLRGSWIRRVVDDEARVKEAIREEAQVEEGVPEG